MQETTMKPCIKMSPIEEKPLAMAYVPLQQFTDIYENLSEGFCNGTIFPELNKPFTGCKGGCV